MSYWNKPFVEFCPSMFCPFNCDVCPQESVRENYDGNNKMDYKSFEQLLSNIPKNVDICFAGYSEPFLNNDFVSMLLLAHQEGYKIGVFTTLGGATFNDLSLIRDIPFEIFKIHLPDGKHLKFQFSNKYGRALHYAMMNIKNVSFICMNNEFNDCGNVTYNNERRFGKCLKFDYPQFQVLPNGSVLPCCQSICFSDKTIGNLLYDDYDTLLRRYNSNIPFDYCKKCSQYVSYKRYLYLKNRDLIKKFLGGNRNFV